jgi:hypothetical protein
MLLLAGCGGGGSGTTTLVGTQSSSTVTMDAAQSIAYGGTVGQSKTFSVDIFLKKNVSDNYEVTFKPTGFSIDGCSVQSVTYSPDPLHLNRNAGSIERLQVEGTVNASCTNQGAYTLYGTLEVKLGDKVTVESFIGHSGGNGGDDGVGGGVTLSGVTTPITVSTPEEIKTIAAYVVDNNGVGVADKEVAITSISDARYGAIISSANVVTDSAGRATFQYRAPRDIEAVNGQNTTVSIILKETGETREVTIRFSTDTTGSVIPKLTGVTTPLKVTENNEVKIIVAYVVDDQGVGIPGKEVSVTAISDPKYGAIVNNATLTSDNAGRVAFEYRAPSDIASINDENTTVNIILRETGESKPVVLEFKYTPPTVMTPIVVLEQNELNITKNGESKRIVTKVFVKGESTPYTHGVVKVQLPSIVTEGKDVGYFTEYNVSVGTDGRAEFNYIAPQDVSKLLDENITDLDFYFYHEDNPDEKVKLVIHYELESDYIVTSYTIETASEDGKQTMGLESQKSFTATLEDDQGNTVQDSDVTEVTIESLNTRIAKLIDDNGNVVDKITYTDSRARGNMSFYIKTATLSGLVPVKITISFNDANGDPQTLVTVMNVVVFSGPPTAISISYAGVEQNETTAKYIEKFAVTVTDAYNNPVNTRPFISVGAIVEYAVDGNSSTGERTENSPRLWHGRFDSHGTLINEGNGQASFEADASNVFRYIDISNGINNDRLVVFGKGYVYEALGKWDIVEMLNEGKLSLKDDYNGSTRSDLFYAVGHNNRQDLCDASGREFVGNMKAQTYQLDEGGHAFIEFEYDYHLTGKDIMVWVNLMGYQSDNNKTIRIGEAIKHTLRGNGLIAKPASLQLDPGAKVTRTFVIHHKNAPEWYINGHFGYAIDTNCDARYLASSDEFDARTCSTSKRVDDDDNTSSDDVLVGTGDNTAWVAYRIENNGVQKCTFTITDVEVAPEFFTGRSYP